MSGIPRVRPARVSDAEDIARVHVRAWQSAYDGLIPASVLDALSVTDRAERWTRGVRDRPGTTWVAQTDRTLGFASVRPGELAALYVDPSSWGAGVGGALHDVAVAHLVASGCDQPVLWVVDRNERARRFYAAHGWCDDDATITETWDGVDLVVRRLRRRGMPPESRAIIDR